MRLKGLDLVVVIKKFKVFDKLLENVIKFVYVFIFMLLSKGIFKEIYFCCFLFFGRN